ncbi:peptidase M24 [Clostridia bacterium]|nr:peptidase M24 [Clostridia bacterium]
MSRRLLKARDKITRKMSRDGLIERNAVTGENIRVSNRETDTNIKGSKRSGDTYLQLDNSRNVPRGSADIVSKKKKQKQRRISEQAEKRENRADTDIQPQTFDVVVDTPKQADISVNAKSNISERDEVRQEQPLNRSDTQSLNRFDTQSLKQYHVSRKAPFIRSKSPVVIPADNKQENPAPQAEKSLNHDDSGKFHFEPQGDGVKSQDNMKRRQPVPKSCDNVEKADTTQQTENGAESPQQTESDVESPQTENGADTPQMENGADTPQQTENSAESPLNTEKKSKLQFAEDEATPKILSRSEAKQQKKYGKAQKQADKAVKKLETAKSKLPTKKKLRSKHVLNEETGKFKKKLYFESEVKSQSEHIKGALPLRPIKAVGNSALAFGHRKMYQVERENVATEAAHKGLIAAEGGIRTALHHHKTAPYRKVQKLELTVQKKSVNAAFQKALAENPKLKGNPIAKAFQKRKIKRDYAKAARNAQKAAKRAKHAGTLTSRAGKALAGVVKRHPVATAVIILFALLMFCLMSLIGAFGSAGSGGLGAVLTASYLAEDADIDNAELSYTEWETDLQLQIVNTESTQSGYDEYRYNVGDISHNPYELMAYMTVKYQNFSNDTAQAELSALFGEQYKLTFTPSTETRYADPSDSNEDGDYEPYDWNILTVNLTAKSFSDVVNSRLSGGDYAHYALLLQTKGSRQYLANPLGDINWLSYITSYYGYRVHPISGDKNYHKGVDIALPTGTPIHTGQDGTVTFAGYSGDYGNVVIIENDKGLTSKYAHCDTLNVIVGQTVKTGDIIATVGNTGSSTGSHLHLEILKNGQYLNPIYFADSGSFSIEPTYGDAPTPLGDGSYAAMIAEAEKYLGYPYVFGGSSPSTSFDCSGFVSWVLTHSGVKNVGRLGATDLYYNCTPISPGEAKPGDLVFFQGTYSTPKPITHVGIYVGNGRMLHCGDPIQYTSMETSYWQQHFFAFGRIN